MAASSNPFRVTFYSGVGTVTGANFLFETNGPLTGQESKKILVDCGLTQGEKVATDDNRKPFAYDISTIDMLFITHAHLDHVGRIPKLIKDGFKGTIYSTEQTKSLARLILDDAVGLLAKEAQREGLLPLYEVIDVENSFVNWKTIPYHENTDIGGGVTVYLRDAGHILGSSMIQFTYGKKNEEENIIFTGDLGNSPTPLLRDTETITGAQYLVMESVYGDRNHEPQSERREKLMQVVNDTIARGGTLLIPAFSLERTQVILYELSELVSDKKIPSVPVFVDSPLGTKVTDIYRASENLFNEKAQAYIRKGNDIFDFPRLSYTVTPDASRGIDHSRSPKIIIASSGMSTGGRVLHHEMIYLPDPRNTILLVGYQAVGTIGRLLEEGTKEITLGGVPISIGAKIESILGYSAHKDSDHLVEFVATAQDTLKKVFVVMGEPKASLFLTQRLRDNLGVDAIFPEREVPYVL